MIDVTKCIGCRKGLDGFTKENEKYNHFDLFNTPEAGLIFPCENSDTIGEFLKENQNGIYTSKGELKEILSNQCFWWEDILQLAYGIFKDEDKVGDFFNGESEQGMMWNRSNLDIENTLLDLSKKQNIQIGEENYPDLLKWKL